MAARKTQEEKETREPDLQQVRFFVEPGAKVQITVEMGKNLVDGKVPLTVQVEQVPGQGIQPTETSQPGSPVSRPPRFLRDRLTMATVALKSRLRAFDLATWLFISALAVYLLTRLVGLTQFPIYFFTDEAIQSQSMIDLIDNHYRDSSGALFPTYFRNGEYYNLSASVYLQWLPSVLFGKSAVATRATSVIITLLAAVAVGVILRDIFELKYWWTGTLFLSITPAWFLHSRTAFETAEFVAFYAGTLWAYLFYRYKSPRYAYPAVFLGALSFYSYSPAQVIVPLTAACLLLSDWRYHWENRRTILVGLALGIFLALPYVRSSIANPNAPFAHLHTLSSYWFQNIPLPEKIGRYLSEFGIGLSPWYWYVPNNRDLSRHLMKDYGNIIGITLPFSLLGLAHALRWIRLSRYRAVIIAMLVSPAAAALVQVSITRVLVFVIPAAILAAIGFEQVLEWMMDPKKRLSDLGNGPGPTTKRIFAALLVLTTGLILAFLAGQTINRLAIAALTILLSLQISGYPARFGQSYAFANKPPPWRLSSSFLASASFLVLSGLNVFMLNDSIRNGPLWFTDYGLGGMQYGAFQIFDLLEEYLDEHPGTNIIFSPDWANGADVVARYFLRDPGSIQMGSIRGHITQKLPLDNNTLFVMTPEEYDMVLESDRFMNIQTDRIIPYPDGNPGFYFIRLQYVDKIDEMFAAEEAVRRALQESAIRLDGQEVKLRFSYLDGEYQAESIALVFDNDPYTVAKTFASNPFVLEMAFPEPRTINGFSIIIGSINVQITVRCFPEPGAQPVEYIFEGRGTRNHPELSFDLPVPTRTRGLQLEVLDPHSVEDVKIHIWELKLR